MIYFHNDYSEGCHPRVLERLIATNFEQTTGYGEDEFVEKKSRFIGHIYKVETPEQCQEILAAVRKKYWDATHNVYAYVLEGGNLCRFSDDGEPQGTAGIPSLDVLLKEEVVDCCVVVTRYFGGILLGAGACRVGFLVDEESFAVAERFVKR